MPRKDITGKRFGKWVVLSATTSSATGQAMWLCRCDCGNIHPVHGSNLRRGGSTQCKACLIKTRTFEGGPHDRTRYVARYHALRHSSKVRNVPCIITKHQYEALLAQPCVYGGEVLPPSVGSGLDQKVAGLGYTIENSVRCCTRHNHMKGAALSYEHMLYLIQNFPELKPCSNKFLL